MQIFKTSVIFFSLSNFQHNNGHAFFFKWQQVCQNYVQESYFDDTLKQRRINMIGKIDIYKDIVFGGRYKIIINAFWSAKMIFLVKKGIFL